MSGPEDDLNRPREEYPLGSWHSHSRNPWGYCPLLMSDAPETDMRSSRRLLVAVVVVFVLAEILIFRGLWWAFATYYNTGHSFWVDLVLRFACPTSAATLVAFTIFLFWRRGRGAGPAPDGF